MRTETSLNEVENDRDDEDTVAKEPLQFNISDINIKTEQQSAEFIIDMLRHDEIDMDTPFQRSPDLWPDDVMSRFIESMLLKLPIPPFYLDISYKLDKDGKSIPSKPYWQVVDGLQRLSAIRKFATQENQKKRLRLTGLDFFPELENTSYEDLPRNLKRNFHSCQVSLFIIYPNTPKRVKHRIFERMNTGGLKLTDQEIRNAITQGNANKILKYCVKLGLRSNGIYIDPGRMRDQELVLRHFSFRILPISEYEGSMKNFLDAAMETLNELPDNVTHYLQSTFISSVAVLIELLGPQAFRKRVGGGINRSLFESYTVAISELSKDQIQTLKSNKNFFVENYEESLTEKDPANARYLASITAATARTDNMIIRFDMARKIIERTLKSD
jgi:hypothetical protein